MTTPQPRWTVDAHSILDNGVLALTTHPDTPPAYAEDIASRLNQTWEQECAELGCHHTTPPETVHRCPVTGSGTMPCCGRTPFEVSPRDRMTLDEALVTCAAPTPPETDTERLFWFEYHPTPPETGT